MTKMANSYKRNSMLPSNSNFTINNPIERHERERERDALYTLQPSICFNRVEEIIFDGRTLASGGQDKLIKLWDMKTGKLLQTLRGHERGVWCLNFFTQTLLVSGSYDGTIKVRTSLSKRQVSTPCITKVLRRLGQINKLPIRSAFKP